MIEFDCALTRERFNLDVVFENGPGVIALFGPSGSGKSTVINLIAGLDRPQRGRIVLDGKALLDTARGVFVPPHRRRVGLVFQDAQLFPHLTVRQNLTYGRFFTPSMDRRVQLGPVVETLGIGHLLGRFPATLSGGERQRVAIGRALLASPRLLLMDEPLASLDANRKLEILPFIEILRDEFKIPIVYVSHAVEEVVRLAAKVVRLADGKVVASGPPAEALTPSSLGRAADRFDVVSMITATVVRREAEFGVTLLEHPAGEILLPGNAGEEGAHVRVAIRATNVTLALGRPGNVSVRTALKGRVTRVETDNGPFALVWVELIGGDRVYAYATRIAIDELGLDAGDDVYVLVKAVSIDERGVSGLRVI